MAKSNKEVLEAFIQKASPMSKQAFEGVDLSDNDKVYSVLSNYEQIQNEFISTLMNRIVRTMFFSKVFKNPLHLLHGGMIESGNSIQQIFVQMGERKGFNKHFEQNGNGENDLIGKRVPTVNVDYISKNYQYKYKVSVSDMQLKQAFLNDNGLSNMCQQLINSNISSAYYDEYTDMKNILLKSDDVAGEGNIFGKGVVRKIEEDNIIKDSAIVKLGKSYSPQLLCEKVRAYSGKLTFPSDKYNLSHVKTWSNKEDLIFFTTPDISAKLDVNVLAQAFNVSSAEIKVRNIEIDELGTTSTGDNILGILADKDIIQSFDIINKSTTFINGDTLTTNYFLHKQGIQATCNFAQCVVFTDGN